MFDKYADEFINELLEQALKEEEVSQELINEYLRQSEEDKVS